MKNNFDHNLYKDYLIKVKQNKIKFEDVPEPYKTRMHHLVRPQDFKTVKHYFNISEFIYDILADTTEAIASWDFDYFKNKAKKAISILKTSLKIKTNADLINKINTDLDFRSTFVQQLIDKIKTYD